MNLIAPYIIKLLELGIDYLKQYIDLPSGSDGDSVKEARPGAVVYPVKGVKTLTVTGAYPKYTNGSRHTGVDFACRKGTKFISISSGNVTYTKVGKEGVPGASTVTVKTGGTFILYKHCLPVVKKGDKVKPGTVLGTADMSGNTTGPHLHFEARNKAGKWGQDIEPLTVLKKHQPRLKYKIMGGKWHHPVRNVFKKFNKIGLDIIEGKL